MSINCQFLDKSTREKQNYTQIIYSKGKYEENEYYFYSDRRNILTIELATDYSPYACYKRLGPRLTSVQYPSQCETNSNNTLFGILLKIYFLIVIIFKIMLRVSIKLTQKIFILIPNVIFSIKHDWNSLIFNI